MPGLEVGRGIMDRSPLDEPDVRFREAVKLVEIPLFGECLRSLVLDSSVHQTEQSVVDCPSSQVQARNIVLVNLLGIVSV